MANQNDNTILKKADLKAYHQKILPYLGGNLMMSTNNSDFYSTDEKVVGVWTDGKPVYQKTVITVVPTTATDEVPVTGYEDLGNLHLDKLILLSCVTDNEGSTERLQGMLNLADTVSSLGRITAWTITTSSTTSLAIQNSIARYSGRTVRAILQYTKSSDAAGSATTTPGAYDINFPNTWPANTEIYFGNGLYGYRAVGTASVTANQRWDLVIARNQPSAKIYSQGGGFITTNDWFCPTPWHFEYPVDTFQCETSMFVGNIEGTKNVNYFILSGSTGSVPYDAWVTYTK